MPMTAIVLAAGEGTRMKSRHPKVMHKLLDRPLVSWVTRAAREAGAERIVVVVGHGADEVRAHLANEKDVECVEQTERLAVSTQGQGRKDLIEAVKAGGRMPDSYITGGPGGRNREYDTMWED